MESAQLPAWEICADAIKTDNAKTFNQWPDMVASLELP
jgi:hypothetical protein